MTIHTPIVRGIQRVNANRRRLSMAGGQDPHAASTPSAVLGDLTTAFEEFKARNDGRLEDLQGQLADVAARAASRGLTTAGDGATRDPGPINAALRSYIRSGDDSAINALVTPQAGMSVGSDPDGGYTVLPTISDDMTRRVFELSPMRQLARVVPVSSDRFEEFNDLEESEAAWVGETESRPDTGTPKLGMLSIPVHEVYAMPKITQKLLDDSSIDLAAWLVEKCSMRFARKEGAAFIHGDGMLKPRGLLTYPTSDDDDGDRPWGTIQHVNTGTSGTFGSATNGSDKLIDLSYQLKNQYRPGAAWLMNRKTAASVRKLKNGSGDYVWQAAIAAGQPDRLLGFPVQLDEEMPDMGADSLSIAFGDFRAAYTIVDRHGLRLLRDPFTDKPNVRFYTYKRSGGAVSNFEAVKFLRFGAD